VIGLFRIHSQLCTNQREHYFIYEYDLCIGQKWMDNFVSFTITPVVVFGTEESNGEA
jgi:hypothetical protein